MNILVEPSEYPELNNIGDIVMQETAVRRVARLFPTAAIRVLTDSPNSLAKYAPNVTGLSSLGRSVWMEGMLPDRWKMKHLNRFYRRWRVDNLAISIRARLRFLQLTSPSRAKALRDFLNIINATNLLIVCGMGGIADEFEHYALGLLDTIDLVKRRENSIVAMFGQGFGPLEVGSPVFRRARQVLPKVELIALREARTSVPLLSEMGVEGARILVTGDDALEIASRNRGAELGTCIGINVRVASYSGLSRADLLRLREPILHFATVQGAGLCSLPTSLYREEADSESIRALIEGHSKIVDEQVTGPEGLIESVKKCRIAIVGSYHAGIFALAHGVPIVGLFKSSYYRDKFLGLQALFEVGVFPVDMNDEIWHSHLLEQARTAWAAAPQTRNVLLNLVDRQIELAKNAYLQLSHLLKDQNHIGITNEIFSAGSWEQLT